ncbi:gluconeogenesis factor YvcK family protein [Deinococcus yavapaiensis]|uniref:Putative gluconeogenesis factor n=1 Tax=Deinococcus yavapaiensis KR-236 TaxID=694435 RepID=A0A318SC83_9DEIO|nr:uridine diphosphate-N-acetylglucosamine-binding protein YvcK [Deinococcus yavapaiensis]PYE54478.1 putative cofD-like protein [Deinococcus yavapaiensis KR-236]
MKRSARGVRDSAGRAAKWMVPGMGVKRWFFVLILCVLIVPVGFMYFAWTGPLDFVGTRVILWLSSLRLPDGVPTWTLGTLAMIVGVVGAMSSVVMLNRSLLRSVGTEPDVAVEHIYVRRALARGPKIVALGGGTGLSNLLSGLKQYTSNITAVVTVSDDGGSSGRLRQALGMIAPGDLTDCYAALSDSPVLARLLLHRFERGEGISGHTFGNLMLATLSEEQGGLANAMTDVHEVLRVRGRVYPSTPVSTTLVAHLEGGETVRGESRLHVERAGRRVERMSLDPPNAGALPEVIAAIEHADLVVIGPGSLFTSLIPAVLVPDVAAALRRTSARVVYVANIMSEPGETDGIDLEGHERLLAEHLGRTADWVLVNASPVTVGVRERYAQAGAHLLSPRGVSANFRQRVRLASLLREHSGQHDPEMLAAALLRLLAREGRSQ